MADMTSPPLDYAAIKANSARVLALTDGKTLLTPQEAIERGFARVCLALLADNARMREALEERELGLSRSQPGAACPSDCAENGPQSFDGPLFADFAYPLRGDLEYIEAALSTYLGGPASDDVRGAWERILLAYRDTGADYLRVLNEKVDGLFPTAPSDHVENGGEGA